MVLKLVVLLIVVMQGVNSELSLVEELIDELGTMAFFVGEPVEEDKDKLKMLCEKDYKTLLKSAEKSVNSVFKGLVATVMKEMIPNLSTEKSPICQHIAKGEEEKAVKTIKAINKAEPMAEAKTVRNQLLAALVEASQKDTKTTFPVLTCYLKEFQRKVISVYPEEDGAKEYIKTFIDLLFDSIISSLEAAKGKAADDCVLPAQTSTPPEYKTVLLAITKAIENLDK